MNIIIFDVPATCGGALTILNEFYKTAVDYGDKSVKFIFILSTPKFSSNENVEIVNFPYIKKSWIHRLYFDIFVSHKLVEKYKADRIFSMQNMIIKGTNIFQTVYLHQPIPFSKLNFNIFKSPILWINKYILSYDIYNTIKKADRLIVQTNWMKTACIENHHIMSNKIHVIPPQIDIGKIQKFINKPSNFNTFFYPAAFYSYKNHAVIIKAVELLRNESIDNFKVIFTVKGQDNSAAFKAEQKARAQRLNIEFAGTFTPEDVYLQYSKSVLIFPSLLETYGLPSLEARLSRTPIIASDLPFSHEILDGYKNASFFDATNPQQLADHMKRTLDGKNYRQEDNNVKNAESNSWTKIIDLLTEKI